MFFNYIFQGEFFDEEIVFCATETIQESIIMVYHKTPVIINKSLVREAALLMLNEIVSNTTSNYDDDVLNVSEKLLNFLISNSYSKIAIGATIYIVNLFIKRLAHLMRESHRRKLRAPLNNDELMDIDYAGIHKMVDIDKTNYKYLMDFAEQYTTGKLSSKKPKKTFKSLYEWELWFWDNF